ncbi:MAG: DUF6288 domain-containing protein [Opitutales bacterium]
MLTCLLGCMQSGWTQTNGGKYPDFTKGDEPDKSSWGNIGPLGAVAYYMSAKGGTTLQIPVQSVDQNSPAGGILRAHDVIGAAGGRKFTVNARKELSRAITEAEKAENRGKLDLLVWRPETKVQNGQRVPVEPRTGETISLTVELEVMGTYSATSPWDCPKSQKIIDQAAAVARRELAKQRGEGIPEYLNGLGLLATREKQYRPVIRDFARRIAGPEVPTLGKTWSGSYKLLFVTEYFLAFEDDAVLPWIEKQATLIAKGVSGVGTWSHGLADFRSQGLYGPPNAYGAMNQVSLTCAMSLVLAQKCGIDNEYVNEAVSRATDFLKYYAHKGSIPYGDHAPGNVYDGNGKNSQAAVYFDLVGDKEAATYFTRMTLASHTNRDSGHTGPFWSWQWGALGASRGGQEATSSFMENTRWYLELERLYSGGFQYQGVGGTKGWGTTGSRLLQYCLPRKGIYLTGRGGSVVDPMTGKALRNIEAVSLVDHSELTVEQLLGALGNWAPPFRQAAAQELAKREADVAEDLIAMLDSPNRYARYGACIGLSFAGRDSDEAVRKLIDLAENADDPNMRYFAVQGLQKQKRTKIGLSKALDRAVPSLLAISAAELDRFGKLHHQLAENFLYSGRVTPISGYFRHGEGLGQENTELVVAAMRSWLTNPNGAARSLATSAYDDLNGEQLEQLWGAIYYAAKNKAPSGIMFAGEGEADSIIKLAEARFEEGLPLALEYLTRDGWGKFGRVPKALEALSHYGAAIKEHMPTIEKEYETFIKNRKPQEKRKAQAAWEKLQENLNKDFKLRSIEPYLIELRD